ncbi:MULTISPECIES: proprotein convertase P-domain-containing protein [unclassified Streptomyces]|uniref:proprotein convertase P-domain-containing protein n=1 Tax=unclassified Streptomyces TaxID=2593676 RepID=UPI002365006C|nr:MULTISPECIES: proprotein convertase P-domain-containing protein [unclassified Streptomyces]MDF3140671.1 proprotein convertase P-domain-containing protein [Streptomyces sp. T21Q-yed]WDF38508.1 proprotein convertase P-domain-containing protein [Streptomyces sp. T12]
MEQFVKRPVWALVAATAAAMVFSALPTHLNPLTGTSPVSAAEGDPVPPALFDKTSDGSTIRVNVVTDQRADLSGVAEAGESLVSYDTLPLITLRVDSAGLTELQSKPGVVAVSEDIAVPPTLNESTVKIGSDKAVAAGKTGSGVTVAVLDTGIAAQHPFLTGRVKAQACFSVNDATYGSTSLCPNGTAQQEGTGVADADTGPCATLGTACSHGTHVAGIAAGDGTGISGAPTRGVAPGADLVSIQVFSKFDSDNYCGAGNSPCVLSFTSSQIKGLEKVLALKKAGTNIVAANMSLGAGRWTAACASDPRKAIIDSLRTENVATVVAAGNNGYTDAVNAPGCVESAVTVGSTTDDDQLSTFTNRGPLLDLFAPGTSIVSSVPGGTYASKNGTSMAAPHVAGALAVLKQTHPDKSITDLESLLKSTGTPITADGGVTIPRIDVGKAVGAAEPEPEPEPGTKPLPSRIINDTDQVIPDPGTVESPIKVSGFTGNAPGALQVTVNLTHEWLGEVKIDLVDPDGKSYAVKTTNGTDPGGTLSKTYTVDASTSPANGTWKLQVQDKSAGADGTLDKWSLTFPSHENQTDFTIPDPGTVESPITVSGLTGSAPQALQAYVDATHEWLGDLEISLVAPDNKTYALKSTSSTETGGTIRQLYTVDASASPANGTWKLRVKDASAGADGTLNGWALTFPASYENQTGHAVPDPGTVESPITVSGLTGSAPQDLQVYVDATHEWLGDLEISLVAPNGTTYALKSTSETETGGTLQQVYTVDASASPANGTWKLRVEDASSGATGTLNGWTLTL